MLNFFELANKDKIALIEKCSENSLFGTQIIEKDIWVCWALEQLFLLDIPIVFKGGTSLSKGYNLIDRFSEDIDITIDYTKFVRDNPSKSKLNKISTVELPNYLSESIIPYFNLKIGQLNIRNKFVCRQDNDKLYIEYESLFNQNKTYVADHILIEFGAKNTIDPYEEKMISTYLSGTAPTILLPNPKVKILHPKRTFWEKATLIHAECNRKIRENKAERLSRHWYDMFMLYHNLELRNSALNDMDLFETVLEYKKWIYNNVKFNYDHCKNGNFRLIPDHDDIDKLTNDYNQMISSGMFIQDVPQFTDILKDLNELETNLNIVCGSSKD